MVQEKCERLLHVEDHCSALYLLSKSGIPGEQYNIGGGRSSKYQDCKNDL